MALTVEGNLALQKAGDRAAPFGSEANMACDGNAFCLRNGDGGFERSAAFNEKSFHKGSVKKTPENNQESGTQERIKSIIRAATKM